MWTLMVIYGLTAVLSLSLGGYLLYALLCPEKF